jgi:hypothetical protein
MTYRIPVEVIGRAVVAHVERAEDGFDFDEQIRIGMPVSMTCAIGLMTHMLAMVFKFGEWTVILRASH